MPRLVTCHHCHILVRIPDPPHGVPLIPARLQWTDGQDFVFRDDKGLPVMVPAYDPVLEDFTIKHQHHYDDDQIMGGVIQVMAVDQRTWDSVDIVTKIKDQLQKQTGQFYAEQDEYKQAAIACYNKHGNPDLASGCRDYLNDDRRIGPAQYSDGEGHTVVVPDKFRQYLCYLCPYQQAFINVELRRRKGYYNGKPKPNIFKPKR
jgi:hypothetical protein